MRCAQREILSSAGARHFALAHLRKLALRGLAFVVATLLGAGPAAAAAPDYTVVSGEGELRGVFFVAGAHGAVLDYAPGLRVKLEPETELQHMHRVAAIHLDATGRYSVHSFVLRKGRVDALIDPKAADRPAATFSARPGPFALAKGGDCTVEVDDKRAVAATRDGDCQVGKGGAWKALEPSTARVLTFRGQHLGPPIHYLHPPEPTMPQTLWRAGKATMLGNISWKPLEGAREYIVEFRTEDGHRVIATRTTTEPTIGLVFGPAKAGHYAFTVRGVDEFGLLGEIAESRPVSVINVKPPEGGYIDAKGVIRLPKGSYAHFDPIDGILRSYEHSEDWLPATNSVHLFRGKRTVVHYKRPGETSQLTFALEPRNISAQITMGPSQPVWPRDTLDVRVHLVDGHGQAVPKWLEPKLELTVGIDPVDVKWTNNGSRFTARVPPQKGPGPWIVRVRVSDQFGMLLGYDSLEVKVGAVRAKRR